MEKRSNFNGNFRFWEDATRLLENIGAGWRTGDLLQLP